MRKSSKQNFNKPQRRYLPKSFSFMVTDSRITLLEREWGNDSNCLMRSVFLRNSMVVTCLNTPCSTESERIDAKFGFRKL